jgi:hypothetical protein
MKVNEVALVISGHWRVLDRLCVRGNGHKTNKNGGQKRDSRNFKKDHGNSIKIFDEN